MARPSIGIWFVGVRGSVATTTLLGLIGLRRGWAEPTGLVSELPFFAHMQLPKWDDFVVGGHDIRDLPLWDSALALGHENRAIDPDLVARCRVDLQGVERNIKLGTALHAGERILSLAEPAVREQAETPAAAVERIQNDLKEFVKRNKVKRVIVVNLASTEPPCNEGALPRSWGELEPRLADKNLVLGASSIYAIAALNLGYPFINFTPSLGAKPRAICDLAELRKTCHAGSDGKTGETLLKSVLAPMFAHRNLEVMSWVGHNIFGNLDGKVLDDPENKRSKIQSKDRLLGEILGYTPQSLVSIEYIRSLGEWKTAWDHIHFRGFLGTPMALQFIWQGCDSLLAAPLVLDLIRFTSKAAEQGHVGILPFLASFFKSPLGVKEHSFVPQFQMLLDWAGKVPP
jgi:myo-inositol-1-phosphate synthase